MAEEKHTVVHSKNEWPFEVLLNGEAAMLQYPFGKEASALMHTPVPAAIECRHAVYASNSFGTCIRSLSIETPKL